MNETVSSARSTDVDSDFDLSAALDRLEPTQVEKAVADFVVRQRWFAAKTGQVGRACLRVLGSPDGGSRVHTLAEVAIETVDGEQRYFLPLSAARAGEAAAPDTTPVVVELADGHTAIDGARDPALVTMLVDLMARAGAVPLGRSGKLRVEASQAAADLLAAAASIAPEHIAPIRGEQSNTSILVGPVAILKFYRRLRDGTQPELEVTRFLTERTSFRGTPALLGSAILERDDGTSAAVAALFERVANGGDAWAVVTRDLALRLGGAPARPDAQPSAGFDAGAVTGRRTGEMHAALGTVTGDPAFDPEPIDAEALAGFVAAARSEAHEALHVLRRVRPGADKSVAGDIDRLLDAGDRIDAFFDGFGATEIRSRRTRIHGDYHLGQLLVAGNDIHILDFEGEPGASLEERRAKSSPLRDVAGMLRSFDYAAFAALDMVKPAGGDVSREAREEAIRWRDATSRDFLGAWSVASGINAAEDSASRLLDLFVLQKAFYELRYEAANRPTWLSIPLRGITALLEKRQVLA